METYKITKYNPDTREWDDFGSGYTKDEVKIITRGFKCNGLFYERKIVKSFLKSLRTSRNALRSVLDRMVTFQLMRQTILKKRR